MISKTKWARSGLKGSLALLFVLSLGAVGQGCSKTTDYGLGNTQGDQFSGPNRNDQITSLKTDYAANIVIQDQTYESEHYVNNVLRYLATNESSLKGQLQNVIEIDIASTGSAVEWRPAGTNSSGTAQFAITINAKSSQAALAAGFARFGSSYQGTAVLDATSSRVGVQINDMIGMTTDQANSFSNALITAAAGLDFTTPTAKSYASTVQADTLFALGGHGSATVLLQYNGGPDAMGGFLAPTLDLAKHLDTDLATVTTLLGVSQVTYQPDTLLPSEVSQGIVSLTAAQATFKTSTRSKGTIMIGRRTETDASKARSSGELLIAFNASPTDIGTALNLMTNDYTSALADEIAQGKLFYSGSGITLTAGAPDFGVTDMTNDADPGVVLQALSQLENAAPVATLSASRITAIQASPNPPTVVANPDGSGTLQVTLTNVDEAAIEAAITTWAGSYASTTRMNAQATLVSGLSAKYAASSITVSAPATYDLSSDASTQALSSGAQMFEQVAPVATLQKIGITTVTLTSIAGPPVVSADKTTLTVDLYTTTAAALGAVLTAATPAPVTPPAPTSPAPATASN